MDRTSQLSQLPARVCVVQHHGASCVTIQASIAGLRVAVTDMKRLWLKNLALRDIDLLVRSSRFEAAFLTFFLAWIVSMGRFSETASGVLQPAMCIRAGYR